MERRPCGALRLDPLDDLGVEAEAGGEDEPARVRVHVAAASSVPDALAVPSDDRAGCGRRAATSRISAVASTGSRERPSARENTLVEPPGTTASVGRCGRRARRSSSPLTTSLTVPSPPRATTRSMPSAAARAPSSRACPRCAVSTTSTLSSLPRAPTQHVAHLGGRAGRRRVDHHERAHGLQANQPAAHRREERPRAAGPPRNLAAVTEPAGVPPQPPRRRAERLFGAPGRAVGAAPARARGREAPRSLRWAAVVVGVEAAALAVGALVLLYLAVTSTADSLAAAARRGGVRRRRCRGAGRGAPSGSGGSPAGRAARSSCCSCCSRRWRTRRRSRPAAARSASRCSCSWPSSSTCWPRPRRGWPTCER